MLKVLLLADRIPGGLDDYDPVASPTPDAVAA